MVSLAPEIVQVAFNNFVNSLRDGYPDGEGITQEDQLKVLMHVAHIADILNLDIPED